jgi:hypothetical protein
MALQIKHKNKCLFGNRTKQLKIFDFQNRRQCLEYQLTGDQKSENEMELDFINTISYRVQNSPVNNLYNSYSIPRPINNVNMNLTNNSIKNESIPTPMKQKKQSLGNLSRYSIKEKPLLNEKQSMLSNALSRKMSMRPGLQLSAPTTDLLLKTYDMGLYDPQNPSHQRGTVKLTEKQKEKWNLPDFHHLVYANNIRNYHPFCFFYGTKYKELVKEGGETRYPEGKLVNYRDWQKEPDYTLKGIYKGIEINDKVGLVIVDPNVKKKYSGLVADIIIQLLKVPFGHHMCLNVKIFEPKCLEERLTNVFSYANRYLIPANDPSLSPYDRFKSVITFIMSGMYIPAQQLKPFNPYLGETFQGELPNGAKIYVEQVTHKPLCARFYMFYENIYKLYGYFNFDVRSEGLGSTMYVVQQGPCTVEFPQLDERVTFCVPEIKIVNARNENGRANLYSGSMVFVDIKNKFKAVIQFDVNKKKFHEMKGCTFKVNYPPGYKFVYNTEWQFQKKFKIDKQKKEPGYLEDIKGSWISNLYIGNKLYWDAKAQVPEFIKPTKTCLPSDGRFREDLCWLWKSFYEAKNETERKNYETISQKWKVLMEDFNRWDRKRRADYNATLGMK